MNVAILCTLAILVFGMLLIPDDAYTDVPNLYCYDEDMEGYICFDTLNSCEREQKDDVLAESECYESKE